MRIVKLDVYIFPDVSSCFESDALKNMINQPFSPKKKYNRVETLKITEKPCVQFLLRQKIHFSKINKMIMQ